MKLTFLGANRQVTGSRYCLEANGVRLMIDCGLVQERAFQDRNWEPCAIDPKSFDALLITHAHIDHIGLIPKFVKDGFHAPIYATHPTVALADVMLRDSAKIQTEDAEYKKRRHHKEGRRGRHPEIPLYVVDDVVKTLPLFEGVDYLDPVHIAEGITATWHDAGHILGSAMIEIAVTENGQTRTVIFSGDIGQRGKPLISDPSTFKHADYVIMESTYGERDHVKEGNVESQLEEIIRETVGRGGNLVIPVFAVERAQELMYYISRLVHANRIPDIPIFLDSPMASDVTNIFRKHRDWLDDETRELISSKEPPLQFPGLQITRSTEESMRINRIITPCIIMAPAGMCNAGRIKHHLRLNIGRDESTILFVGHQAKGTLGRRILDGEREVRILGRTRRVYAKIKSINGLSAHADRSGLIDWLSHLETPPLRLFITHGEEDASLALARTIRDRLGWESTVPEYGTVVDLDDEPDERTVQVAEPKPVVDTASPATDGVAGSTVATRLPTPDFEFFDSSVRPDTGFLHEDPWRVFRMQSDTIQGIDVMARALEETRRSVAVFGSARLSEDDPVYVLAHETCRRLGECGFATITGGGPGVMEAANRGAREAGALSIGLNIDLPREQRLNAFCDVSYTCRYFFVRKMLFAKYARAFVIFAGGYGTMDELFEALTLIQTERLAGFPVILVGSDYWNPLVYWLRATMYSHGCISETDLSRFVVVDSPEEVVATLEACISCNGDSTSESDDSSPQKVPEA
ncbi:MAG: TIGR00730 family Rossman fold protein [Rhodopirellula sp.]|nr:TIGR00730 family Rossman fold protein [Rhodopirellula sp.]